VVVFQKAASLYPKNKRIKFKLEIAKSLLKEHALIEKRENDDDEKNKSVQIKLKRIQCINLKGAKGLAACDEALKALPDDSVLHHARGKTLLQMNLIEEAKESFMRALRFDPYNSEYIQKLLALEATAPSELPKSSDFYRKSHAVVIGIDDYENWPVLEYGVNSALSVCQKLKKFGFDNIIAIIDKEAVKERIINELFNKLAREVSPEDRVLIYFAGHIHTEELSDGSKRGYIITAETPSSNFKSAAITIDQLKRFSYRIPAKHILYVVDSCFSAPGLNNSFDDSLRLSGDLGEMAQLKVVQFISAGNSDDQVQILNGKGLFTTFFLKAIEGEADIVKDGIVTGTELIVYLQPRVSIASQYKQTPLWERLEGGEFFF
jgi:tetratricopeptide (TPR) repeat protein